MVNRAILAVVVTVMFILPLLPVSYAHYKPATEKIIVKAVPTDAALSALERGDIDVYLFGIPPRVLQPGVSGVNLYPAPSAIVDIILNPAPVMIVEIQGKHDAKEAAQILGVDPVVVAYTTYIPKDADLELLNKQPFVGVKINDTDVTIVELCAKPLHALPATAKVLWENPDHNINPFCLRQVRYAINYLVDRSYIVENIYKGYAIPMHTLLSIADPIYPKLADVLVQYKFTYDPDKARAMITDTLSRAGAELRGNKWYYGGEPITIVGVARVEDERKDIGELLAAALRDVGFDVNLMEVKFSQAISLVYFSDPKDLKWSFYTEGWGKGGLIKWPSGMLAQFYAAYQGWMPGLWNPKVWNYRNPLLDYYALLLTDIKLSPQIIKDVAYIDYLYYLQKGLDMTASIKNEQEYLKAAAKVIELGTNDSVRIWVAEPEVLYAARSNVAPITVDLGSGLRNPFFYRSMKVSGSNEIKIGHLHVYTTRTVYDPFGGFNDVYSVDIMYMTYDPWIWSHPFTGDIMPFRVKYTVYLAPNPDAWFDVPDTAVWWDAENDAWVPAKQLGRDKALAKVTFDLSNLISYNWHDGEKITMADIVAYIAEMIDIAYDPSKSKLDPDTASSIKSRLQNIVAFEFKPEEKKLVVYLKYWFFDPDEVAAQAAIGSPIPATLVFAMDYLAYHEKKFALGDYRARSANIPHLNLVLKDAANAIMDVLPKIDFNAYKSYITLPDGKKLMTLTEWVERVGKAIDFIKKRGHAWISNGPYILTSFDPDKDEAKLEATMTPLNPVAMVYGIPGKTKITMATPSIVVPGTPATVTVSVTGVRPIYVQWILLDEAGNVIAKGVPEKLEGEQATLAIPASVTTQLEPGKVYRLHLVAWSTRAATVDERDVLLTVTPPAGGAAKNVTVPKNVTEELAKVKSELDKLKKMISILALKGEQRATKEDVEKLRSQVESLKHTAQLALAIAIVAVLLAAWVVYTSKRTTYQQEMM